MKDSTVPGVLEPGTVLPPAWVAAALASGRFDPWPVLEAVGGPHRFGQASVATLTRAGLPPGVAARIPQVDALVLPFPAVLAGTPAYPAALRAVPYAPPVLFVEGSIRVLHEPLVAIVGTRRCTATGRRMAAKLSRAVCLAGGVVVSGLARGIDTAAHHAAVSSGRTVAVLGQGLGQRLPASARDLRVAITGGDGAVVSEFLPSHPPGSFTFLQRNRIIAGLGRVTVVVEAARRSGARSTASHALAAGRDVLAVPGNLDAEASQGCLDLIEQGATMVRGPHTVLAAANLVGPATARPRSLPASARVLEDALNQGGTVEQLAVRAGLSLVQALCVLADLEAAGLVVREPGQRYRRA